MSALLPCPFCGGEAHWAEPEVNMPYVGCKLCGACIQDEVRWNQRFSPRQSVMLAALEKIASVDMGGGFLGAQACRKIARSAIAKYARDE